MILLSLANKVSSVAYSTFNMFFDSVTHERFQPIRGSAFGQIKSFPPFSTAVDNRYLILSLFPLHVFADKMLGFVLRPIYNAVESLVTLNHCDTDQLIASQTDIKNIKTNISKINRIYQRREEIADQLALAQINYTPSDTMMKNIDAEAKKIYSTCDLNQPNLIKTYEQKKSQYIQANPNSNIGIMHKAYTMLFLTGLVGYASLVLMQIGYMFNHDTTNTFVKAMETFGAHTLGYTTIAYVTVSLLMRITSFNTIAPQHFVDQAKQYQEIAQNEQIKECLNKTCNELERQKTSLTIEKEVLKRRLQNENPDILLKELSDLTSEDIDQSPPATLCQDTTCDIQHVNSDSLLQSAGPSAA